MSNNLNYKKPFGLYIHFPFCQSKCSYCDFYSITDSLDSIDKYIKYLKKEMYLYSKIIDNKVVKTVYIGGGTPSLLSVNQVKDLINTVKELYQFKDNIEITVEANPESLFLDKIKGYKEVDINRVSLGVQSFDNKELKFLNRAHDKDRALKIIGYLKDYFENFNIDLIFAIPRQSFQSFKNNIDLLLSFKPPHISLYNLEIEKDTPLYQDYLDGKYSLISDEMDYKMYNYAIDRLTKSGYQHYEISNFAKPGYQSKHNKIYWYYQPYLGLGCSAHGFNGLNRYKNVKEIKKYFTLLDKGKFPIKNTIKLSKEDLIAETMMMGLRLIEGVDKEEFEKRFNITINNYYKDVINKLKDTELLAENKEKIYLTKKGINLANLAILEFI